MTLGDAVLTALILAGALSLLYRSLWSSRGACHGCSSGGCRPASRESAALVSLGRGGSVRPPRAPGGRP